MNRLSRLLLVLVLLGGAGYAGYRLVAGDGAVAPAYSTQPVDRGDIRQVVNATGTLNAVTTVTVGSQVSGIIVRLHADYNSVVKAGQVVAEIDPSPLRARLLQAEANLKNARAAVSMSGAAEEEAAARAHRQELTVAEERRKRDRSRELFQRGLVTEQERDATQFGLDAAEAALRESRAQESSARARVEQAEAQVQQAEAAVEVARLDLEHALIHSPIDGVVISRDVQVGQTVAASFQAPTLFTIARDLREMQVEANVDEADIGVVREGMEAAFTVDAFPSETFTGRVAQVRLSPINVQNVITYITVIRVDNPELKLRPGMTAVVTFHVAERRNVLRFPSSALRFRPEAPPGGGPSAGAKGPFADGGNGGGPRAEARVVYVPGQDGAPAPREVVPGLTDGTYVEVVRGDLPEGQPVITGLLRDPGAASGTQLRSPLAPQRGMGRPRQR